MTRTRSQDIKNNNLKVPSKKGTTVEPTSRPTVVSVGTLTEGLWGRAVDVSMLQATMSNRIPTLICGP